MRKKVIALAMIAAMVVSLTACGGKNNDKQGKDSTESLKVAYQSGIAYAPILVMKDQKLIEKNYDGNVDISISKAESDNISTSQSGIVASGKLGKLFIFTPDKSGYYNVEASWDKEKLPETSIDGEYNLYRTSRT